MKRTSSILAGFILSLSVLSVAGSSTAQEMTKVKVALAAFQDVNTIYVGIAKGFYAEEGIELVIQNTDWPGAQELLIGGHADMAASAATDVILENAQGQDTTLTFPLFFFAGTGMNYDAKKHDWKTLNDILPTVNGDIVAGIKATLAQAKGTKVGLRATSEYSTFLEILRVGGLDPKDYTIVDLAQEELPPALIAGSIDIMMGGIPQRLAVLKEGYPSLMDQTAVRSTVEPAGFATTRAWADKNFDLAVRIEKVILKTLAYIENNEDESFAIIANKLGEAGTKVDAAALKGVWNVMEFFPNGKAWWDEKVVSPSGQFYWKERWEAIIKNLTKEGKIKNLNVPLEDMNYGLKVVAAIKE